MDLRKAAALCLGLWSAWLWAAQSPQAAAVLPSAHRQGAARRVLETGTPHRDTHHHFTSRKDNCARAAVVPHEYMLSLYRRLSRKGHRGLHSNSTRDRVAANTIASFVDQGHDEVPLQSLEQNYLFDTSTLSSLDEIVGAELRILHKPHENLSLVISDPGNVAYLHLYTCATTWQEPILVDSRSADLMTTLSKWEVFNVWKAMDNRKSPGEPLCFTLKIVSDLTDQYLSPAQLGFNRLGLAEPEKALLVVSSYSKRKENLFKEIRDKIRSMENPKGLDPPDHDQRSIIKRRRKRTTLPTRTSHNKGQGKRAKTRCSKKPLHVNFKELGWDDWIIAPLDYEAYHCEGMCDFPLRSHLEPTNHAIIQTLMNSMDPESTPPSCCVPSKLSPISILYIDSGNNVVYKQYEDMVVENCGCR
ncbi:growth/differentiation factor 7 [Rana temporaria]|uniref:growth/differentiation factor 7 n=1 Tax=Rana temporaria TaxID=8407 RepID=UPI001AAD0D19|nr:growth/differentiation factor 7 [Rana temporaria]